MLIYVKVNFSGITLNVEPSDTIKVVKAFIESIEGKPADLQTLFFNGRKLQDEFTLSDYKIENESTLEFVGM